MSSLGDVVLTEPVVGELRRALPDAEIGFLVKRRFLDLVASNPHLTRVHTLDDSSLRGIMGLRRELAGVGYDVVIDLHRYPRSLLLSRSIGARRVITYRKREFSSEISLRLLKRPFKDSKTRVQRYLDTLVELGIGVGHRRPRLHLSPDDLAWSDGFLGANELERGGYACISPGAAWPLKRWPESRFAELAKRISSELGLRIVLTGSRAEAEVCDRIKSMSGLPAVVTAGRTRLGQLGALLSRAGLFVGNDSGPTHVSMAVDTPTVAIFGPIDPGQFDFEGHELVYADLPCSACTFFGPKRCRRKHWECILSIGVDDVARAAARAFSGDRGSS